MDFLAVIEAIGFDFALIGTLATLVIAICAYLVRQEGKPVARVLTASIKLLRAQIKKANASELVLLSVLVAIIGMTFNIVADQMFDRGGVFFFQSREVQNGDNKDQDARSDEQKAQDEWKQTHYSAEMCERAEDFPWRRFWQVLKEEDAVKQDAARDVCARSGNNSPARAYISLYTGANGAKALAQQANASVMRGESSPITTALRLEFLAVKITRVLALCAGLIALFTAARLLSTLLQLLLFLFVASIAALSRWIRPRPTPHPRSDVTAGVAAALQAPHSMAATLMRQIEFVHLIQEGHASIAPIRPWFWPRLTTASNALDVKFELKQVTALSVLLALATGGLWASAWMWNEQADTYYKKLFYAHLEAKGLDSRPVPTEPAAITASGLLGPELTSVAKFRNTDPSTGKSNMFEFSGVTSFGGRVIVADNETSALRGESRPNALFAVDLVPDGDRVRMDVHRPAQAEFPAIETWDDIEGLASDSQYVYAVGSHSISSQGFFRGNRQALLRLRPSMDGKTAPSLTPYTHLYGALFDLTKELGLTDFGAAPDFAQPTIRVLKDLNIEGLEAVRGTGGKTDLLLGLRAPLVRSVRTGNYEAIVLRLQDVNELFNGTQSKARITTEARLDLQGKGIAAIEHDKMSDGYLLAAAPANDTDSSNYSSLWLWKPQLSSDSPNHLRELLRFPKHKLEGIARLTGQAKPALLLTFDEEYVELHNGERVDTQFGQLALLEHGAFK